MLLLILDTETVKSEVELVEVIGGVEEVTRLPVDVKKSNSSPKEGDEKKDEEDESVASSIGVINMDGLIKQLTEDGD